MIYPLHAEATWKISDPAGNLDVIGESFHLNAHFAIIGRVSYVPHAEARQRVDQGASGQGAPDVSAYRDRALLIKNHQGLSAGLDRNDNRNFARSDKPGAKKGLFRAGDRKVLGRTG